MKSRVLSTILLLSLSQFGFAAQAEEPTKCPSIAGIQTVGISYTLEDEGDWYGVVRSHSFDTNDNWTFAIGAFDAADENEAMQEIMRSLNSLSFMLGDAPMPFDFNGVDSWVCAYKDNSGHQAVAITPVMDDALSLVKHKLS